MKAPGKAPGFWFYPGDFERDVQMLSLSAQGLWIRMLGWMHENESNRGFLELPTGAPMLTDDIAAKVGKPADEIETAIAQMERIGIFSRDARGCLYCRRMARDTHISEVRREAAKHRADAASRAADGCFAGVFAGAKHPAKFSKTPTVTVSDSVSDSSTTVAVSVEGASTGTLGPRPVPSRTPATPAASPNPQISQLANTLVAVLMPEHIAGGSRKAAVEAASVALEASHDPPGYADTIRRAHERFRPFWASERRRNPKAFIPQLHRWLADGDYLSPPSERVLSPPPTKPHGGGSEFLARIAAGECPR